MAKSKMITIEMAKFVLLTTSILVMMPNLRCGYAHEFSQTWARTVVGNHEHTTVLQFYFHDTVGGDSPTGVEVVPAPNSTQPFTGFGFITMADVPLTVGPDPNSKLVGRSQGLYGSTSRDGTSLLMVLTLSFSDGMYNGSSISILAMNKILQPVRELAVTGGTGMFRMVRGYAVIHTYSSNPAAGKVVVGYNVTLVH